MSLVQAEGGTLVETRSSLVRHGRASLAAYRVLYVKGMLARRRDEVEDAVQGALEAAGTVALANSFVEPVDHVDFRRAALDVLIGLPFDDLGDDAFKALVGQIGAREEAFELRDFIDLLVTGYAALFGEEPSLGNKAFSSLDAFDDLVTPTLIEWERASLASWRKKGQQGCPS